MNIQMTLALNAPDLKDEELQAETQALREQMLDLNLADRTDWIAVKKAPKGAKALGGFLLGMLTAEVNPDNFKKLMRFLCDRISHKTIKLKIKAPDGREIELEASSPEEFALAMAAAEKFLQHP